MKNGIIEQQIEFDRFLSHRAVAFSFDSRSQAEELVGAQQVAWNEFREAFSQVFRTKSPAAVRAIFDRITNLVVSERPDNQRTDRGWKVTANYPLLRYPDVRQMTPFVGEQPWIALAVIVRRTSEIIAQEGQLRSADDDEQIRMLLCDPRFAPALAEVTTVLTQADSYRTLAALMDETRTNASEQLAALILEWGETTAKVQARVDAAKEKATEIAASHGLQQQEQQLAFQQFLEKSREQIEAARAQAMESGILKGARKLWSSKALKHGCQFWVGLAGLVTAVYWAVSWAIVSGPDFIARLPKKADGELAYATVAMMAACVIAAGWILRFIGRFVTENMVMQTDAAQREAMIRVYLALVGDEKAKMEQADRTLILNAIFRPLPGHQSEDVAPPTLVDVVKSATGKV